MAHRESVPVKTNREQLGGTEDGSGEEGSIRSQSTTAKSDVKHGRAINNRRWRSGCLRQGRKFVRSLF